MPSARCARSKNSDRLPTAIDTNTARQLLLAAIYFLPLFIAMQRRSPTDLAIGALVCSAGLLR
jgi:hypothetical protein